MASVIRQNFHENSEAAINKQINMELYASYVYLSMVRNSCCNHAPVFNRGTWVPGGVVSCAFPGSFP